MVVLKNLWGAFIRINVFKGQQNVKINDLSIDEATAPSGSDLAPVEKCTTCPAPYQGAFCEECVTTSVYHKIIDYNSTVNRFKCVPCKEGYLNSPACNQCEEGYSDKILNRPTNQMPECVKYLILGVEPETQEVYAGRRIILTCTITDKAVGYNGTAWLLQWQRADGKRVPDSVRVFQVRTGNTVRLVINDADPSDGGRYRCEGFNRRSQSTFAFTNITVLQSPIKKVMMKSQPLSLYNTKLTCSIVVLEPLKPGQLRITLSHMEYFDESPEPTAFAQVMFQTQGANTTVEFIMNNNKHSGYWICDASDMNKKTTVSSIVPVLLRPGTSFTWDLKVETIKVGPKPEVGSAVKLECKKLIRSPEKVNFPIEWEFQPLNPAVPPARISALGSEFLNIYSAAHMFSHRLPAGVWREGDSLILDPVTSEHWGNYVCRRKPVEHIQINRTRRSLPDYSNKEERVLLIPKIMIKHNVKVTEGGNITLDCLKSFNYKDIDGLPCHRISWAVKKSKSAAQSLGRAMMASSGAQVLVGQTSTTLTLKNVEHDEAGMYYCRCHTFFRPNEQVQSSKLAEYNLFVAVTEDKPPKVTYKYKVKQMQPNVDQWLYCEDKEAVPPADVWWEIWDQDATKYPGIKLASSKKSSGLSFSNITYTMDINIHQVFFKCIAKNSMGESSKIINFRYSSLDYNPMTLRIILYSTYHKYHAIQKTDNNFVDTVYSPLDQFGERGIGYRDNLTVLCHVIGNPWAGEIKIEHNETNPSTDSSSTYQECKGLAQSANVAICSYKQYWSYAKYKDWKCTAKQLLKNGTALYAIKQFKIEQVPNKIKVRMHYYKWYNYTEDLHFHFLMGGNSQVKCEARYQESPGGPLKELPFAYEYEFYLYGFEGIPHYGKQIGDTLYIEGAPAGLDKQEILCFVVPKKKEDIKTYGFGQRYFKTTVFQLPPRSLIQITMQDKNDASLILRNPELVTMTVGSSDSIELKCTLGNYNSSYDISDSQYKYLDWYKCKNSSCRIQQAESDRMQKRMDGNNVAILTVKMTQHSSSGFYMCAAVRKFTNVYGQPDTVIKSLFIKIFAETAPGVGNRPGFVYSTLNISKPDGSEDIVFKCTVSGFPYPELEITRFNKDNRNVERDNPKWILEHSERYFDPVTSNLYGAQLQYRYPKENQAADNGEGFYKCKATNKFATIEVEKLYAP